MATPAAAPRPSAPAPRRSRLALARARHRSVLRRPTDRLRSAVVELELLALLAAVGLCALLGFSVQQHAQSQALEQAKLLRPVQAQLVAPPYPSGVGGSLAQVSWTAPGGGTGHDTVSVPSSDRVGDLVQIWLDSHGTSVAGPQSARDTVATGALTGLFAFMGAGFVVVSAGAFARSRLDRHDEAAWDAEWRVYEPLWTRRR